MYTLVLMSALSTAPDTAEFNGFFRRLFSFGGGCSGGSCTGSSASGGCTGNRLRAYSGCCGGSARAAGSCTGSSLAPGSCTGSALSLSCSGGMGAPMMMPDAGYATPTPASSGFYYPSFYAPPDGAGCTGGGFGPGLPSLPSGPLPGLGQPFAPPTPAGPPPEVSDSPNGRGTSYTQAAGRATVVVRVPADAVLFAEGRRLLLSGAERTFTTPPLPAGDWGYTFRVEYTRDGETVSRTKRVGVRPGDALTLEFTETGPAVASAERGARSAEPKTQAPPRPVPGSEFRAPRSALAAEPARLTIKLPPGGTLTVDGKTLDRGGEFRTPPLAPGREYRYQVQADTLHNGRPARELTTVSVKAGELVTLDFTAGPK